MSNEPIQHSQNICTKKSRPDIKVTVSKLPHDLLDEEPQHSTPTQTSFTPEIQLLFRLKDELKDAVLAAITRKLHSSRSDHKPLKTSKLPQRLRRFTRSQKPSFQSPTGRVPHCPNFKKLKPRKCRYTFPHSWTTPVINRGLPNVSEFRHTDHS